jgi:hypothetical protein
MQPALQNNLHATHNPQPLAQRYLAHESNHAPLQVPLHYVTGFCADNIPIDRPARRIVCGMMRAVDASLANVTEVYKSLGVWKVRPSLFPFLFRFRFLFPFPFPFLHPHPHPRLPL